MYLIITIYFFEYNLKRNMKGLKIYYGMQPNKYKVKREIHLRQNHTRIRALRPAQDIVHQGRNNYNCTTAGRPTSSH